MIGTTRKAEIVEVVPNQTRKDEWGYPRHYAGYARAVDDAGEGHIFVNGSFNGVHDVEVGDTGTVTYTKGAVYALWFFEGDKK